jgi:hypothetical protein
MGSCAGDADALTARLLAALLSGGGAATPDAASHAAALSLLDEHFPELRHFAAGAAVAASPAAGDTDKGRGEYFRTTGALFALAAALAAHADPANAQSALDLVRLRTASAPRRAPRTRVRAVPLGGGGTRARCARCSQPLGPKPSSCLARADRAAVRERCPVPALTRAPAFSRS